MSKSTRRGELARHHLRHDANGAPVAEAARVAVALLFWEVANIDGDLNGLEHDEIMHWLERDFELTTSAAAELIEIVLAIEGGKKHLDSHLGEINKTFSPQQREHLFQVLMEIVTCDKEITTDEMDLVMVVREKLNLPVQG